MASPVEWTDGKALIATGSPFDPVKYGDKSIEIAQSNNFYIFPGLGMGVLASGATRMAWMPVYRPYRAAQVMYAETGVGSAARCRCRL